MKFSASRIAARQAAILKTIGPNTLTIEEIILDSGVPAGHARQILRRLESDGVLIPCDLGDDLSYSVSQ